MNYYLFPKDVVEKENLTCINMHHAILPYRPGRNQEAWAIWEGDAVAGITWHYILPAVDAGDILIQVEIPIRADDTSISLFQKENAAALKALESILPLKPIEEQACRKQDMSKRGRLRYSKEAPNDGWLDLSWNGETIYRFLRAMNYGTPDFFMYIRVLWDGKAYRFFNYRKMDIPIGVPDVSFDENSRRMTIKKDGFQIDLFALEQISVTSEI